MTIWWMAINTYWKYVDSTKRMRLITRHTWFRFRSHSHVELWTSTDELIWTHRRRRRPFPEVHVVKYYVTFTRRKMVLVFVYCARFFSHFFLFFARYRLFLKFTTQTYYYTSSEVFRPVPRRIEFCAFGKSYFIAPIVIKTIKKKNCLQVVFIITMTIL